MPSSEITALVPAEWMPVTQEFFANFLDLFDTGARGAENQQSAAAYLTGLVLPSEERKSVENLAEKLPGVAPHQFYQFLAYSPWNPREVQTRHAQLVGREFATPLGVLALDDTGIPKQGRASVGVAHQYLGIVGKVANGQTAVSVQYVLPDFTFYPDLSSFLVGMELYLPDSWAKDRERRARAFVPEDVEYQPKWRIGLTFIDRARALRLPHRAVVGDAGFGAPEFRRELRHRLEPYLVGVQPTGTTRVKVGEDGPLASPAEVANGLPTDRWATIRWAKGSKGPLEIEAARVKVSVWEGGQPTDEHVWLIFERRSNETKAYLAWGLDKLSLVEQVRVMRSRFPIEQSYQQMKEELGLDQFEGRSWRGFHHHVTMVGMAQGFLMLERRRAVSRETPKKGAKRQRLPTVPTVRKWLNGHVALGFIRLIEKHPDRRVEIAILMAQVFGSPVWVKKGRPYLPSLAEFANGEGPP
ncbi:MAG: IS701 family transposase [Nitrosotalea sp.]